MCKEHAVAADDDVLMRKWDDVSTDELLSYIAYLKQNYDPELSHNVIELFHERMRDGSYYAPEALHILMEHVFARIIGEPEEEEGLKKERSGKKAKGVTADQAFGLKRQKGKYEREDTIFRDIRAAAIVILQQRKGVSTKNAVIDAADALGVSETTIRRACAEIQGEFEPMRDEILIELADTELPPP